MNNTQFLYRISRRNFLKSAGCLTIGFSLMGSLPDPEIMVQDLLSNGVRNQPKINAWLEILENGKVRILTKKVELGQELRGIMRQVAAEELDLTSDQVEVILAETGRTLNEEDTSDFRSMESSAISVRYAAASAREKLIELAAEQSHQAADQFAAVNGKIISKDGRFSWTYNEVLKNRQIEDEVRLPVRLKPVNKFS